MLLIQTMIRSGPFSNSTSNMWMMQKIDHATRTVTLNKEFPVGVIYIVSVAFCWCWEEWFQVLYWNATIRYRCWWQRMRARLWCDNIYTSARNGRDGSLDQAESRPVIPSSISFFRLWPIPFNMYIIALAVCRFAALIYISYRSLSNQQSVGGSSHVQSLRRHFWDNSLYTLSTQVSHSTLRCYTRGKIAEISMSRVIFANFNEMATYELSGRWSSQTSYYPSKLNVRSREQSDTANLAIGFEYKHFSVVCHEWYQALRLILFSHNNITIQRSTMQKTSLPVWLQMPCRWSLAIIHRTSNHVPVQTPPSASNRLHARRSLTKHPVQQFSWGVHFGGSLLRSRMSRLMVSLITCWFPSGVTPMSSWVCF